MRIFFAILALTVAATGQNTPTRIPPDEAAKHLIKQAPTHYPYLAEAANIQGVVLLEITIDESGKASVRRLVAGHPMLAPDAMSTVNLWKYQPFEVDGKPAAVLTFVAVSYGGKPKENEVANHSATTFAHNFWTSEDTAQAALAKGDYVAAEQQLNTARDALATVPEVGLRYSEERWRFMISMGRLAMGRQKYEEAEPHYKQALELRQKGDKDAPELAATFADLARLYTEEKRYDLARDHANRSIDIYQKDFKKAGSSHPDTQAFYGRAIAYQSWMLSKLALQQNDSLEAAKQCRMVLDFQSYLAAADHDSVVSACEGAVKKSAP